MAIKIINPIISEAVGGGGASFNIHYGLNPPEDTSMLWVETESEPTSLRIAQEVMAGDIENKGIVASLPTAGNTIACCRVGNKIYQFGGYGRTKAITVYDTETNIVDTLGVTIPYDFSSGLAFLYGDKIYLVGVRPNATLTTYNRIYSFDYNANEVKNIGTTPFAVSNTTGEMIGSVIYLFGRTQAASSGAGTVTSTIGAYDCEAGLSSTLSISLPSLANPVACAVGKKVYLFGGVTAITTTNGVATDTYTNDIYVFDTERLVIEKIGTLPKPCYMGRAYLIGEKIYIFGGFASDGSRMDTIHVFDTTDNSIAVYNATLNATTINMGLAGYNDQVYLFGGYSGTNLNTITLFATIKGALTENTAHINPSLDRALFPLLVGDNSMELGVSSVYVGNSENLAEPCNAYLYNETSQAWELI